MNIFFEKDRAQQFLDALTGKGGDIKKPSEQGWRLEDIITAAGVMLYAATAWPKHRAWDTANSEQREAIAEDWKAGVLSAIKASADLAAKVHSGEYEYPSPLRGVVSTQEDGEVRVDIQTP